MSDSITSEKSSKGNSSQPSTDTQTAGKPSAGKPAKKTTSRLSISEVAEGIRGKGHRFACGPEGGLYHYEDGVYRPNGEKAVRREVLKLLKAKGYKEQWERRYAKEVIEWYLAESEDLPLIPDEDVVNLRNGMLNVVTREFYDHSPTYLSMIQLPVEYDPEALCPVWEYFVDEVFPEGARTVAWEIVAWTMTSWDRTQSAILLVGGGSNGKSAFLEGLRTFLGRENTCALPLHRIEQDKFSAARLFGKLSNIHADIPAEKLSGTDTFKALTGGDAILGERKFKDSWEFVSFAKLLFSVWRVFQTDDSSHGFTRRWVPIPFTREFDKRTGMDPQVLKGMLSEPQELSGLLNKALDVVVKFRERRDFFPNATMAKAYEEFKREISPLRAVMEPMIEYSNYNHIPCGRAYERIKEECLATGCPVPTPEAVGKMVKMIFPRVMIGKRKDRFDEDRRKNAYLGVGWVVPKG
jgi:P4 family phage/plasmid primase-like protien